MCVDLDTVETAVVLSYAGALCCTHLQLNGRICLCIPRDTVGIPVLSLVRLVDAHLLVLVGVVPEVSCHWSITV